MVISQISIRKNVLKKILKINNLRFLIRLCLKKLLNIVNCFILQKTRIMQLNIFIVYLDIKTLD